MLLHHGLQFTHNAEQQELTFWPCQWPLFLCLCPHLLPGRSAMTLMGTALQSLTSQKLGCLTCTMQGHLNLQVQQHDSRHLQERDKMGMVEGTAAKARGGVHHCCGDMTWGTATNTSSTLPQRS